MKLYFDDKVVSMIFSNKQEEIIFKDYFTWEDDSKAFQGGKYNKRYVKKVQFIKKYKNIYSLYVGFLQEVLELIKKHKIKVTEIKDKRTKFPFQKKKYTKEYLSKYFPFEYIDHQVRTLQKMLKVNRGIIKVPTSGGKTEIISSYIKETKLPTLVLVNEVLLANQTQKRIHEFIGEDVGIWTGKKKIFNDKYLVATIGSVKSVPSLRTFKVLIIDESHVSGSKTFQDFLKVNSFPIQFGFSATPNKGKEYHYATIRQFMGNIVSEVFSEELMENKVISKPKIIFIESEGDETLDWQSAAELCIAKNTTRNNIIADIIQNYDLPTVVLINDVKNKQGEYIKDSILANTNKTVEYISGSSKVNRDEILADFESGKLDVLIGTRILNQGINIKRVRLFINAGGGKSFQQTIQKLGRSLRTIFKNGIQIKDEVLVIDFLDNGNRFTLRHSKERMRIYKKEGYTDIEVMNVESLKKSVKINMKD